jgi:hypothetical protein
MMFEWTNPGIPLAAIAAGGLLLLWGQRDGIASLWRKTQSQPASQPESPPQAEPEMPPAERFERFFALRMWCEQAGQAEAVKALDGVVLPAIVKRKAAAGGGLPT